MVHRRSYWIGSTMKVVLCRVSGLAEGCVLFYVGLRGVGPEVLEGFNLSQMDKVD